MINTSTKDDPFAALPAALASLIGEPSRHRRFSPGQPLTIDTVLPNQVLLILEGQARLLTREQQQPATLRKLNRGSVVGLASLVSAAPCETVHASTSLKAALLSDKEVAQLLREVPEFSNWCLNQIWDAELARLIRPIRDTSAKDLPPLASKLDSVRSVSKLIDQKRELVEQAIERNQRIFVASANSDLALGTEITHSDQIDIVTYETII